MQHQLPTPAAGNLPSLQALPQRRAVMSRPRCIAADHLRLALVARKVRPGTRWAAMSNGAATASCRPRQPGGGYWIHQPPLLTPLTQGFMVRVLNRARCQGRSEVLHTWGTGIRALQAEFSTCILRAPERGASA